MSVFVTIACPSCPRDLRVRREHVGRRVVCKFCSSVFRVPTHLDIPCPECGQEGTVRAEHLGRKIRCKTCMHVFRARIKPPVGRTRSDLEVVRLLGEIDRRERQLSALRGQLDEARVKLVTLDSRARSLTDSRDLSQCTEEYSTFDEPAASESSCGTDPDLPLADLDDSESDEPLTRVEPPSQSGRVRDDELTHTRLAEGDTELEMIREERDRLRNELDRLHEASERTVITRGQTENLECELAVARADNVRLASEREEVRRTAEGLMRLLHERDAMIIELARERDGSRAAFDLAEAARLDLVDELQRLRSERSEVDTTLEPAGS